MTNWELRAWEQVSKNKQKFLTKEEEEEEEEENENGKKLIFESSNTFLGLPCEKSSVSIEKNFDLEVLKEI